MKTRKYLYRANGKALAMNETDGFIKLVISNDKVIGGHILGAHASTIIHEIAMIMENKMTLKEASDVIHAHPTLSEVLVESMR